MTDRSRIPVIVSAARTPIGRFLGGLSGLSGPDLGAHAIRAAVERAGIDASLLDEVIMGNVVQGGVGRLPRARLRSRPAFRRRCRHLR